MLYSNVCVCIQLKSYSFMGHESYYEIEELWFTDCTYSMTVYLCIINWHKLHVQMRKRMYMVYVT